MFILSFLSIFIVSSCYEINCLDGREEVLNKGSGGMLERQLLMVDWNDGYSDDLVERIPRGDMIFADDDNEEDYQEKKRENEAAFGAWIHLDEDNRWEKFVRVDPVGSPDEKLQYVDYGETNIFPFLVIIR